MQTQFISLSSSQHRYWLMSKYYEASDAYNMSLGIFLEKTLNEAKLKKALLNLTSTHSVLNLKINEVKAEQYTQPIDKKDLPFTTLTFSGNQNSEEFATFLKQLIQKPFRMADDYLWRLYYIKFDNKKSYLYLIMHHIIADAWSFSNFFKKLSDKYQNENNFAHDNYFLSEQLLEEKKYLTSSEQFQQDNEFWKNYLDIESDALRLPYINNKPEKNISEIVSWHFNLNEVEKIKQLAIDYQVTFFSILFSAYCIFISRLSGNRNFYVGTMTSGRTAETSPGALGCFANILPVKASIHGDTSIKDFIVANSDQLFDILEHQQLPYQNILDGYRIKYGSNTSSLFETLFVQQNSLGEFSNLFGDRNSYLDGKEVPRSIAEFPIFILIRESRDGLYLNLQYAKNLFDESTIKNFQEDFRKIILDLTNKQYHLLADYLCASKKEEEIIHQQFNNTAEQYCHQKSYYQLFAEQAAHSEHQLAVMDSSQQWTYQILFQQAELFAAYLYNKGIRPHQYIAICLDRNCHLVAMLLAILKLNCAYVPLDPVQPTARLQKILQDPEIQLIVCENTTLEAIHLTETKITCVVIDDVQNEIQQNKNSTFSIPFDLNAPCYRLFTSGSTGEPKSVTIFQNNLLNLFSWAKDFFPVESLQGFFAGSSINFDASVIEIFVPLLVGGSVIIAKNGLYYHELSCQDSITTLMGTPSAIATIIRQRPIHSSVNTIFLSGEPVPKDLIKNLFQFSHIKRIINGYGLTELTAYSTVNIVDRDNMDDISIGKPIKNNRIYIINEFGKHAPIGVTGDIYIAGIGVPRIDQKHNTRLSHCVSSEINHDDGHSFMFKTGDIGYFQKDGKVICLGRSDSQIKLRGYRIDQAEIESQLRAYNELDEVVVCLKEDEKLDKVLVAFYTTKQKDLASSQLRDYLAARLPNYMVPTFFVKIDKMPVNNSGKIDRKKVIALPYKTARKNEISSSSTMDYEKHIIEAWQQLLGIEQIQADDSFFLLGGHSLLIPEVSQLLESKTNQKIPLVEFFMRPTVKELANYLAGEKTVISEAVIHSSSVSQNNLIESVQEYDENDIAIIGLSCRLPKCNSLEDIWHTIASHQSLIDEIPVERWDWKKYYHADRLNPNTSVGKWGAFIDDISHFDHSFFNLSKREAKIMDPQQRLLLETSWETLEIAGYSPSQIAARQETVGVFIGASFSDYAQLLNQANLATDPYYASGNSLSLLANRISYILGLNGPSLTLDTACSASFTALHYAIQSIRTGETNLALAGGVALMLVPENFIVWSQMGILAASKNSSAFDINANGFIPGEAVVTFLLKPAKNAVKDRDNIWGIIKGTAVNHDGRSKVGLNATSPKAQADLVLKACHDAKINVKKINYIECHGTGTQLGDAVEVLGLKEAFSSDASSFSECPLGSVKPITGHTGPAAGATSLLKVLLAFKYQQLPPTKVSTINPELHIDDTPFYVNTHLVPWNNPTKIVGISAFGFGGSNAHIIVQNYQKNIIPSDANKARIFVLSARSQSALTRLVAKFIHYLDNEGSQARLTDICYTLSIGREHFEYRLAIIIHNKKELKLLLKQFLDSHQDIDNVLYCGDPESSLKNLAMQFVKRSTISWESLYEHDYPFKITLPTYPFEKVPCWYSDTLENKHISRHETAVDLNWLHTLHWARKNIIPHAESLNSINTWFIFMDNFGFGVSLAEYFRKQNKKVVEVYSSGYFHSNENGAIYLNPLQKEDYGRLFQSVTDTNIGIIHGWNLSAFSNIHETELEKYLYPLLHFSKVLTNIHDKKIFLKFITNNTKKILPNDVVFPILATVSGFLKTLAAENPHVSLQLIDYSFAEFSLVRTLAQFILEEELNSTETEIAFRNNQRYVPTYEKLSLTQTNSNYIKQNGTYLILGGLGGIGQALAIWLHDNYAANIMVVGRNLSVKSMPDSFAKRSQKIFVVEADVNNYNQLKKVFHECLSKLGNIQGVFHLAGSLSLDFINNKSIEDFKTTLLPKINGAINLIKITEEIPVEKIIFFSSLSSILGTAMLSDYAAANSFLDSLVHTQPRLSSISWCGWKNIGMGHAHGLANKTNENYLLNEATAFQYLETIMASEASHVIVAHPDLLSFPVIKASDEQTINANHFKMPSPDIKSWIQTTIARLIEMPIESLNLDAPLFALGMDSFLLTQLSSMLNADFSLNIQTSLFYEHSTPNQLIAYLVNKATHSNIAIKKPVIALNEVNINKHQYREQDIAIIGISCAFNSATTYEQFWQNLVNQYDGVIEASYETLVNLKKFKNFDSAYVNNKYSAGFINYDLGFEPEFFNISPAEAGSLSDQQKLLLQLTYHALETAAYTSEMLSKNKVGVFVGAMPTQLNGIYDAITPNTLLGFSDAMLANRLSHFLNLSGPSLTVNTLCSSSLTALHLAVQSIRQGESDYAFVAGIRLGFDVEYLEAAKKMNALSPTGKCRSFSKNADGFVPAEGGTVLLIKPANKAIEDHDHIWAIIRGSAINHGGQGTGLAAPNPKAQKQVIQDALSNAEVSAESITYIEAHGTGTEVGDPIEIRGLSLAFDKVKDKQFCGVGSVKTNIGHCEPAAGLASVAKLTLALYNKKIPATLHLNEVNPQIDFADSPFYLVDKLTNWNNHPNFPRRAGVSAFGISGSNAHVIFEEAPVILNTPQQNTRELEIISLSAHHPTALEQMRKNLMDYCSKENSSLKEIAYTLNTGRKHLQYRLAICADTIHDLIKSLSHNGPMTFTGSCKSYQLPKIVFVFTGQGSQYWGMARELYENNSIFKNAMDCCDQILKNHLDKSIIKILYENNEKNQIDQTIYSQPAIFCIEYALYELLLHYGVFPSMVAGHSLGEYVAAYVAGACTLEDALAMVCYRARLVQALPENQASMIAVAAALDRINPMIGQFKGLEIAAINSDTDVTLSMPNAIMDEVSQYLLQNKIAFQKLNVPYAFHSVQMDIILKQYENFLHKIKFKSLQIPLVSNVTGAILQPGHVFDAKYWCQHMRQTVLFHECLINISNDKNCQIAIEIGSHPALMRYMQKIINKQINTFSTLKRGSSDKNNMALLLAGLSVQGVKINWLHYYDKKYNRLTLPTYPFKREYYPEMSTPMLSKNDIAGEEKLSVKPIITSQSNSEILLWTRDLIATHLQLPIDSIDDNMPLIEMGADSLLLASALASLNQKFRTKIRMVQLFEDLPTIIAIANYIEKHNEIYSDTVIES